MADRMDYTMDDAHQAYISTTAQCRNQPHPHPHQSPNSNNVSSQSRDAHHYDPVHNTESWHGNGSGHHGRPSAYIGSAFAGVSANSWTPNWGGLMDTHRGPNGGYQPEPYQPTNSRVGQQWIEPRVPAEQQLPTFGFLPGMYGDNEPQVGVSSTARNSGFAAVHPQPIATESQYQQYLPMGMENAPATTVTDSMRRAARHRNNAMRAYMQHERADRDPPSTPTVLPGTRNHSRGQSFESAYLRSFATTWDSDSEDDEEDTPNPEFVPNPYRAAAHTIHEERRLAAARGAILAQRKSVASKAFIASSLEKVKPNDLKEEDRTCMICYNDLGIENPDGLVEQPVRLPKCKHVFGDRCIKKWLEDSDSCPYCRDKLPSESANRSKHPAHDLYQQANARRLQMAAQASAQAQALDPGNRPGYLSQALEGSALDNYGRDSLRQTQDEYNFILRGGSLHDAWTASFSPAINRSRESEYRRNQARQARGRPSSGRPTSVGSARYVAPAPPSPPGASRANSHTIAPQRIDFNPATWVAPGLIRQHSTGSVPTAVTPPHSRLREASSASAEEASPPVAVGSGFSSSDPHSLSAYPAYQDFVGYGSDSYPDRIEPGTPPSRSSSSGQGLERQGQAANTGAHSADLATSHPFSDFQRWSR